MNLILDRLLPHPRRSIGVISVHARPFCFCLEDVVRAGPKVAGQTAIPAGRYRLSLEMSGRFGPDTITLNDVPNFTYIRVHPGMDELDTEGCLIAGFALTPQSTIKPGTTRPAVAALKEIVRAALDSRDGAWIEIVNHFTPQG